MVVLSLAVNGLMERAMNSTLATNEQWAARFDEVNSIGSLASAIDAPGNDVFLGGSTRDLRLEMRAAYDSFSVRADLLKEILPRGMSAKDSTVLVNDLNYLQRVVPAIRQEAESVFTVLDAGDHRRATRHMARMDEAYGVILSGMRTLRADLTAAQNALLRAQRRDAEAGSTLLRLSGLLVLLLAVGGGTLGYRLAREAERQAAEREQSMALVVQAQADLEEAHAKLTEAHQELESFSYSVAHDLRAPLRSIHGFSEALEQDAGDALPAEAKDHLGRIRAATLRMARLIDDLLRLSKVSRQTLIAVPLDLSVIAREVIADLRAQDPDRAVEVVIAPRLEAEADPALARVLLQNLLGNAWKFTRRAAPARIEFTADPEERFLPSVFVVRDNGAGFDMTYANKLFGAFQRMHTPAEFEGTGVGLATAQRIVRRHGGRIWAEAAVGKGATFRFTLRR